MILGSMCNRNLWHFSSAMFVITVVSKPRRINITRELVSNMDYKSSLSPDPAMFNQPSRCF